MAKTVKSSDNKSAAPKTEWQFTRQHKLVFGIVFILFAVALLVAFISSFMHGYEDQSTLGALTDRSEKAQNLLGKFGAILADIFINRGFGIASFLFVKFFAVLGASLVLDAPLKRFKTSFFWDLYALLVLSIGFGFFADSMPELGGTVGYEMNLYAQDYVGSTGIFLLILLAIFIYLIFKIKINPDGIKSFFERRKQEFTADMDALQTPTNPADTAYNLEEYAVADVPEKPVYPEIEEEEIPNRY